MKKSRLFIIIVFTFAFNIFSFADFNLEAIKLIVHGNAIEFDVAPVIVNDRTMVPVRMIKENFECIVNYQEKTKMVRLAKDSKVIWLTIDNNKAKVSGENEQITLETTPFISQNRIFVPLRFIAETFNEKVNWDAKNRTITIGNYQIKNMDS